ncbi:MAG: competence protein ComEA [Actinomycetota bacterium]|nr:competence protein ComEA [Actinomycetota bacterium]
MEKPQQSPDRAGTRVRLTVGAGVVLVLLAAMIAVLVSAFAPKGVRGTVAPPTAVHSMSPSSMSGPSEFVHVVGAVNKPGLYELPPGDRVIDAVAAAGGFTASADQAQVNLARVVSDGEQLVVPRKGATPAAPGSSPTDRVNINTADATALQTLDGIGPALAQRILDFRQSHGGFSSVNDLRNVAGIGDKKFAAIKDHIET